MTLPIGQFIVYEKDLSCLPAGATCVCGTVKFTQPTTCWDSQMDSGLMAHTPGSGRPNKDHARYEGYIVEEQMREQQPYKDPFY